MAIALLVLAAFVSSAIAVVAFRPLCMRIGLVDHPGGRKSHSLETPLCGGIAIALTIVAIGAGLVPTRQFFGFALGLIVLLVLGALDDRKHVPAPVRLAMQVFAVGAGMCYVGMVYLQNLGAIAGPADFELGGHAIWFTIFGAVGIINAVNMIDGVDGLAGGFALLVVGVIFALAMDTTAVNTVLLALTIGSLLGFLVFNLRFPWQRQARIFLGDAGSLALGFILAWFAIQGSQGPAAIMDPITAVWLFGLPVCDTVYLMGSRLLRGKNPLAADRYHFHHLLQQLGLSPGWTLYAWLSVAASFIALGWGAETLGVSEQARCVLFLATFAVYCSAATWVWNRIDARARDVSSNAHS